jgi:hypothetical protein
LQRAALQGDHAPDLALVAARCGDPALAARLLGASDSCLARGGNRRLLLQRRSHERTLALLHAAHPKALVDEWMGEGAALGDEVFLRLPVALG